MALLLHIETATKWCSVALSEDDKIIALQEAHNDQYIHSEKTHLFIDALFDGVNYTIQDLSAVAISSGPGSYTGLRIGAATAKGFCAALNIPLIALSSLQVLTCLAKKKSPESSVFIPMIDARRMEVFYAVYNSAIMETNPLGSMIFDENLTLPYHEFVFFGDGAEKGKEILNALNGKYLSNISSSASNMIELAWKKFQRKDFENLSSFEPVYGKEFIAGKPKKIF